MDRAKVAELREKRARLVNEARELIASCEDRGLTGEDAQKYERMEADIDGLTTQIRAAEKMLGIDPAQQMRQVAVPDEDELRALGVEGDDLSLPEDRAAVLAGDQYAEAFETLLRFGPRRVSAEQRAALQVGTDSEGGFTVPTGFLNRLLEEVEQFGVIRTLAFTFQTASGNSIEVPKLSTKGEAAWTAEEAAYNESEPTFAQETMAAHKATRDIVISRELLQDSGIDIEGLVIRLAGESFGTLENTAFADGTGTGQPTGFLDNIPAGNVFTGGVSATAVISWDDLIETYYQLPRPYRGRASWVLEDGTEKALRTLKNSQDQYVWVPSVQAGTPDTILGRPVFADPDIPAMAPATTSVVFADFSGYWIRDVQALRVQRLNELHARKGQVGFVFDKRVDGKLLEPYKFAAFTHGAAA